MKQQLQWFVVHCYPCTMIHTYLSKLWKNKSVHSFSGLRLGEGTQRPPPPLCHQLTPFLLLRCLPAWSCCLLVLFLHHCHLQRQQPGARPVVPAYMWAYQLIGMHMCRDRRPSSQKERWAAVSEDSALCFISAKWLEWMSLFPSTPQIWGVEAL